MIRLLEAIFKAYGIVRPHAAVRRAVADAAAIQDPFRLLGGCLERLGIAARPIECTVEAAVKAASDHRNGFLLLSEPRELDASFMIFKGRITRIPNAKDGGPPSVIALDAFLEETQSTEQSEVRFLQIEHRPNLDLARDAKTNDEQQVPLTPFRRLMRLLAPDSSDIAIVILFSMGVGILSLATPIAVQSLVNFVAFGGLVQPLFIIGILLFAFLALAGAIRTYKSYIVEVLQRRIFVRVASDLAYRLPRVQIGAFDARSGPELVNRFFDVMTVQKASATFLLDGVGVLLQAFIGLLILAFYHPFLLAFDVVLIAAILFVVFVLGRGAVKTAIRESKAKYAVAASLEEIALNPLTFKQFGGGEFAWRRTDSLAAAYVGARRSHFNVVVRQIIGAVALQAFAGTALLTLGGFLVIQGELTLGQLVAAELIVSVVLASFAKFGKQLESIYDLLAGVDKLGQLIDLPLERQNGEQLQSESRASELAFVDVGFTYDDGLRVLDSFDLRVAPGECVLVVGDHGAGKSTLTDLLCAARAPSKGRIELDGVDFRELSLDAIRRQVAVVKGLEIVEGTIAENVRLDRSDVSNKDIRQALANVGLLESIRSLPDGLDTHLNNFGRPLSYGQARRLMVARALAGRPSVIVLDNVLDDLDVRSREIVVNTISAADRSWTSVVTSHRTHTLPAFSRVIELAVANRVPEVPESA